jgi:AcrR family transcriptional regulator
MAERSSYHHGDLRRALLEAAAAEIAEVGPSAISLRSIARRAGVSHAAPAHHFGDRAGLLAAVAAEGFRRMNDDMLAAAAGSDEPLIAIGRAYVDFARANPGEFAVMFRPELLGPDPDLEAHGAAAHQRLTEAIAATPGAVCDGEDPAVTSARLWSLVHGLATLIITGSLPADDDLVDEVLRG